MTEGRWNDVGGVKQDTEYCDEHVCLSVCLSVCLCESAYLSAHITQDIRTSSNFLCMLHMAILRSSRRRCNTLCFLEFQYTIVSTSRTTSSLLLTIMTTNVVLIQTASSTIRLCAAIMPNQTANTGPFSEAEVVGLSRGHNEEQYCNGDRYARVTHVPDHSSVTNKAIVESRLRPRNTTHDQ